MSSSLLFRLLYANKCTSTHHKLVMDALLHLESVAAAQWQNLFVRNVEVFLDGSKAPDKKFKDFRNHVLHVNDNYWGGAVVKAEEWYQRFVDFLKQEDWQRAVYSAGVMSHYISDPFMPLHTQQSEAEGAVHRACEWSVARSYDSLIEDLCNDLGGYPSISLARSDDWLAMAIIDGAQEANRHYDTLIDHYNLERGVRNPTEGLDQECRDIISNQLGRTIITLSRVFDRAIDEAGVTPPETSVTVSGYLTGLTTPVYWLTRRMANKEDKAAVREIYREVQEINRAMTSLPEDEKTVRALHAEEVLGIHVDDLEKQVPRETGSQYGTGTPWRNAAPTPVEQPSEEAESTEATSATDSPADAEQKTAGTKFGQSAWRERRRKKREQAAERAAERAAEEAKQAEAAEKLAIEEAAAAVAQAEAKATAQAQAKAAEAAAAAQAVAEQQRVAAAVEEPPTDEVDEPAVRPGVAAAATGLAASLLGRAVGAVKGGRDKAQEAVQEAAQFVEQSAEEDLAALDAATAPDPVEPPAAQPPIEDGPDDDGFADYMQDEPDYPQEPRRSSGRKQKRRKRKSRDYEDSYASQGYDQQDFDTPDYEPQGYDTPDTSSDTDFVPPETQDTPDDEAPVVFERVEKESRGPRFYLELDSPIVDAPSIGGGTAKRLRKSGIRTVADLLECDVELTAEATRASYVTEESLTEWQNQARLQCRVPGLRGHDAQLLAACGFTDPSALGQMEPDDLLAIIEPFAATSEGESILRSSPAPDREEIANWIEWAGYSRTLRAA